MSHWKTIILILQEAEKMFSLFRMENYRFVRTRTVHVITAILIAVTILGVVISAMTMKDSADAESYNVSESVDLNGGKAFVTVEGGNSTELNICQMFTEDIAPVLNMVFWGIIIAIYIYGEYKNGFVKSIGGQIPKKGMLCASKMYIMAAYTLCMYAVEFVIVALTSLIYASKYKVVFGFQPKYLIIWLAIFALYMGISGLFILICTSGRNSAIGIGVAMIVGFGMTSLVYNLINWLLVKIGITSFNISMYMPDTIMQRMSLQTPTDGIVRAFVVGGVFTIATICVSMILQNKRDI